MKITDNHIPVFTHNTGEVLKASIDTDHWMIYEAWRSKIYQRKETWLQEILSNAYDAHVEVGKKDVPIEVYLPNNSNSNLVVKDYGPGISPALFQEVYLNILSSTKRDTNDQLGGFNGPLCQ